MDRSSWWMSLYSISIVFSIAGNLCFCEFTVTFDLYQSTDCKINKFAVTKRKGTVESSYYPTLTQDPSGIRYIVNILGNLSSREETEFEWVYFNNEGSCCWAIDSVKLEARPIGVYSTTSVRYRNCFENIETMTGIVSQASDNFRFKSCKYISEGDETVELTNCPPLQPVYKTLNFSSPSEGDETVSGITSSSVVSNFSSISVSGITPSLVLSSTATIIDNPLSDAIAISTTTLLYSSSPSSLALSPSTSPPLDDSTPSTIDQILFNLTTTLNFTTTNTVTEFLSTVTEFLSTVTEFSSTMISESLSNTIVTSSISAVQAVLGYLDIDSSLDDAVAELYDAVTKLLIALDEIGKLAPNTPILCSGSTEGCTKTNPIIFSKVAVTSLITEIKYPNQNSITISLSLDSLDDNTTLDNFDNTTLNTLDNTTINIVSYYFSNLSSLLKPSEPSESIVSPIISALLQCTSGCDESIIIDYVIIQFNVEDFNTSNDDSQMLSCVSIQLDRSPFAGVWNNSGCSRIEDDTATADSIVKCNCSHLTHFAILLSPNSGDISEKHRKILNKIGFVLVPISLVCMIGVIVVYIMIKSLWNMRTYVHIMLCASMFMAQLLFITGVDRTNNEDICSGISMVLEYLFLVTFMWMLMEGVVLYVSLSKVFIKSAKYYIIIFTTVSYGIPAVYMAVIIPIGVLVESGNKTQFLYQIDGETIACWLNYESHFIWSFISPVIIIILINIGFFIMTIIILRKHEKRGNKKSVWKWIKVAISLTTVMGITWLGGVFAFTKELVAVAYVMTILISAQGLIIFVLLVLMSKQVRSGYHILLKKHFPNYLQSRLFTISSKLTSSPKGSSSKPAGTVNGIVLGTFSTDNALSSKPTTSQKQVVLEFKVNKRSNDSSSLKPVVNGIVLGTFSNY